MATTVAMPVVTLYSAPAPRDGAALIVNDLCAPAPIDLYSDSDLESFGLQGLYRRSCTRLGVDPVEAVLRQLPSKAGEQFQVSAIDCRNSYLGRRRTNALISVIAACPRLTHINLSRVRMDAPNAKALIKVLMVHPGVVALNISGNDIGVSAGEMLLRLVMEHRRVHTVDCGDCLIVPPVLRKIAKRAAENFQIREQFTIPLIPDRISEEELAMRRQRDEDERLRLERAAAEHRRIAERLPSYAPAALLEMHEVLHRHRHHMQNVFAVFKTVNPGDAFVTVKNFHRGLKILDVRTLSNASLEQCAEFANLFCAYDRAADMVNFRVVIATLRTHAERIGGVPVPPHLLYVADAMLDARQALQLSFEMIDCDATGTVAHRDAVVGVAATTNAPVAHVEELLAVYGVGGDGDSDIAYGTVLAAVTISAEADAAPPVASWELERTQLRSMAEASYPIRSGL